MLLSLTLPLAIPGTAANVDVYIGTYTDREGSRGIYHARLDERTGVLSTPTLAIEAEQPSFLAIRPDGRTLYAVHETNSGEASAYRVDQDGGLTLLNSRQRLGAAPCHLSVDPNGRTLRVANYGAGSVVSLPIGTDGALGQGISLTSRTPFEVGPNRSRQEASHLHAIVTDARSRFAYACDLGADRIWICRLGPRPEDLEIVGETRSRPGAGPRHLILGARGRFLYVNNELDNTVVTYAVNGQTGGLSEIQSLSSLPEGFSKTSHSAEIAVHPNGRWLYVSNRGHDSLAVFAIGKDGRLSHPLVQPVDAKEPRGFGIDPSGRWMLVAGQNSDVLLSYPIDPSTGRLGAGVGRVAVAKPTCVAFVRK